MQARVCLKNYSSMKSQTKRGNLLLFSTLLIISFIVNSIITSCEDKGEENEKITTSVFTTLEINIGRTVAFGGFDEIIGKVIDTYGPVIAEGAVSNSKSIIKFKDVPNEYLLKTVEQFLSIYRFRDFTPNISNPNARIEDVTLWVYNKGIGPFDWLSPEESIALIYCNADCDITGTGKCESKYGDSDFKIDIHLRKGWNMVIDSWSDKEKKAYFLTTLKQGTKWTGAVN